MKKLSKKKKSEIVAKAESKGLDYYLSQGLGEEDFKDTEHEGPLKRFIVSYRYFENLIEEFELESE